MTTDYSGEPPLPRPMLAMIAYLSAEQRRKLARSLHQQVNAPPEAAARRIRELSFLGQLLNRVSQLPETLPYIARREYSERRMAEAPDAPSAAVLVKRYGSWRRACCAAWGLLPDGRKAMGSMAALQCIPGRPRPRRYSIDECVWSVRACAASIGRIPSSRDYHNWQASVRRRARDQGQAVRIATTTVVLDRPAPNRVRGSGWQIVVSKVFGNVP